MELRQGARLGNRFKVVGCLGSGSGSPVFLAADHANAGSLVALKMLSERFRAEETVRRELERGVSDTARLSHHNLRRPIEYFDQKDFHAVSMEYVEGEDLAALLRRQRLSLVEAWQILFQIACGLELLHENGLVHGDVKPANVLVTAAGTVKLTDGTLKNGFNPPQPTSSYAAPETFQGKVPDARSDVYSWGMIAFDLLHGSLPDAEAGALPAVEAGV